MRLSQIPVFSLLLALVAAAMLAPALMGAADGDWEVARVFLYSGIGTAVFAAVMGLALAGPQYGGTARREISILCLGWLCIPAVAAVPLWLITPQIGLRGAIFEMVADFTTTGGTVYGDLDALPRAVHLWRGLVGWLGGLLSLAGAYIVLAPRRLGGFEIEAATWRYSPNQPAASVRLGASITPLDQRIRRAVRVILPIYAGLTALLGLLLSATGQSELDSFVHAMAVLSTSGISPHRNGIAEGGSLGAEMFAAIFLVLAVTRQLYSDAAEFGSRVPLRRDPEVLTMAGLVLAVGLALFGRHWIGALTLDLTGDEIAVLDALWGTLFTVLSFLTTTGFVSAFWDSARDWSGWANPGLILLALAAIGGGAATTAGGIKLIRAYALMRHGLREVERIAQPHSILGVGARTRSLLREGPAIVWTFMMLFIFAILLTVLALTALGLGFIDATMAAISAISNTGQAFDLVADRPDGFSGLTPLQREVLAVTMIIGRIEVLAFVALFNPDAWGGSARRRERSGKRAGKAPDSNW
ncbi:potassium transporter TrkG [Paralimibaculum aggregatum]|uniref:Potassium transporter TrkG n=1 Tax=Paralimibaculum aggregatum TaxID=3036245 RepID=A0ABQ6LMN3_9RHOB|nr:potassium transporter TrkG [Limibaculum sp. NKW23]GMG83555.1 potassium transporter TrkG [Limibaculum sp. NKW23]